MHAMKACGEVDSCTHSLSQHYMEVSGEVHALAGYPWGSISNTP